MKRSRGEDIYGGGFQLNSLIISDPDKARKIALTYLKDVKGTFPDKYTEFVDIMKDFKAQRADITGVSARVKELFKGHPKLILGFNTFLPKGCEIVLSQEDELEARKAVEFDEAMRFVHKMRTGFQGDDHVYKYFLDIMDIYRKETKFITKVHQEVAALLYNQPDLLNEFTNFLPNSSAAVSNHYVHSSRTHKPHIEDRSSIIGSTNPRCSENKDIACLADNDVSVGCDMGAGMVDHYQDNNRKIHGEKEKVKRKNRGQKHSKDKNFDNQGRNNVIHKHKSANTLEDTVIELFRQDMREQVISLHEKVKERLQGLNDYQTFLKYIMHYRAQNITRPQLRPLVNDLLGAYPDLIEEVNGFIDRSERDGSLWSGHLPGSFKSEDEDRDKDHDRDEMIRCREITGSKTVSGSKRSLFPCNNEYQAKPIHELDLSECEQCTPSYRLLPKNYPIPSASQRTKIGAEVLNDHWVSVTSGSEDYSFKHMRKNQYEESLFRCEDDRFELDMLLESVNVTTRQAEELLNKINNNSIKTDFVVQIEDYFTALNLRCIERLYGDNRLDVMNVLRKNASLALPVILTRLKQKQEEWARCRFDFNKIWAEIYAKNYHKSLDHRSFYFKQQDSKSLSTKALLAEIKEIREEKFKEENIFLHFASGERQNSTPHQEFKYCDLDIHDDIYQLMKYYIPQNCTMEQCNKVMKIWLNFVEPLFNVPIRRHLSTKNGGPIEGKNVHKGNNSVKEREKGDISPNGDFEDDFATYAKKTYQNRYHGNGLDKEAYEEGEESAHRPYCDSSGPEEQDGFHDNKAESDGEAQRFLETAKPLTKYTPAISHNEENDARVFYGNDAFYVFFRLHQTLYSRLKEAKENSANEKWRGLNGTAPNGSYARFLVLLYTFLGGDADNAKYEDECRAVLGTWSFPLFTLDKLIYKLSKQLLAIAMDEVDNKLLSLYKYEDMKKPGRFVDKLYYGNARVIVNEDNIYRFERSLVSKTDNQTRLTIRLMNPGCDTLEAPSLSIDPEFEAYHTNQLFPVVTRKKRARIFLKRNKRKYACGDEDLAMMRAMEGVQILNMMECKINCITYKMSYVLDTEDSMVRKGRKTVNNQKTRSNEFTEVSNGYSHRVQKFHKLLQYRILCMQI